ncbi:MAG TPA: zinc carboxypeptidase [Phaeodactylibacter sp.]|nr:zinc carboxypeptidase [Phaeodactylibacter sp.]
MNDLQKNIFAKALLFFFFCGISSFSFSQKIKSPDEFLPHQIGEAFTPHHLLVDYFEYVAEASEQVHLQQYGLTNEKRPLLLAFISSKENLAKLEEIRNDNLIRAGIKKGTPKNNIAIVWLSYSVHGNEAAGSESSMPVLYNLVGGKNLQAQTWLKNTLIIIDPSVNPDGYSRYTHWVRRIGNHKITTNPDSWEHHEPYPGGRMNHYLFDLNRDWAWQTQIESQQRMAVYNKWLPQVHADLHEMYRDAPYYFAPAAQPYHRYISQWQSDFQITIGKNHAKYFDKNGWRYYTKEIFDLFYPSYGDTYPIFNGAIGMTYEQGGSGTAGREVNRNNGETISLKDRVIHHMTTSLSTIEATSRHANSLLENFEKYFKDHTKNPVGKYKSFVIKHDNSKAKTQALLNLLDKNKIKYGLTNSTSSYQGYEYSTGRTHAFEVNKNDIVINAYQPRSVLVQVLFEPEGFLVDSLTYDITAWSLPYAYGLEAYATKERISVDSDYHASEQKPERKSNVYGFLAKWESLEDVRFLGKIMDAGITVRAASTTFAIEGKQYLPGTLVITRGDNRRFGIDFEKIIWTAVSDLNYENITTVSTGFSDKGVDLGSEKMILLKKPKVAVLAGDKTSPYSFGQIWHFFEQDLDYPITTIPVGNFAGLDLDKYSLLILPEGWYSLEEEVLGKIKTWVRSGGRVIVIGNAVSKLADKPGFSLKKYAKDSDKSADAQASEQAALRNRLEPHAHHLRKSISNNMPGAIFKLNWDNTHPLGFGMPKYYFSLKTSSRHYPYLKNAENVGHIGKNPLILGFVGAKAKVNQKETTVFAVQNMGRGNITYMVDNPLFRAFWYQGKMVFANGIFMNQNE